HCIGCYSCWVKTPGLCVHHDDMPAILCAYVHADVVVLASPLKMGNVSSRLKAVQERIIPTMLPYLCIKDDRLQHVPRYNAGPAIALLLGENENEEDVAAMKNVFFASKSRRLFVKTMNEDVCEVAHAINGI
ncbi:MAG: hypothetical protein ABSH12_09670, partial [Endomicrobiales bacterium]